MLNKREIVGLLKRDELLEVVDKFGLEPPDRRGKVGLMDTVASSRKATLEAVLGGLKRAELKGICRELGVDESGKEKAVIIERLTGVSPPLKRKVEGISIRIRRKSSPQNLGTQ